MAIDFQTIEARNVELSFLKTSLLRNVPTYACYMQINFYVQNHDYYSTM